MSLRVCKGVRFVYFCKMYFLRWSGKSIKGSVRGFFVCMWVKFSEDKVKKMLIFQSFWMIVVIHFFCNFSWKEIVLLLMVFVDVLYRINKVLMTLKELSNLLSSWIRYFKLLLQEQFFKIKNDVAVKFEFEVKEFFFFRIFGCF